MNNHLKLIIYIAMIAGIFFFVQDRFDFFDVTWKESSIEEGDKEEEKINNGDAGDETNQDSDEENVNYIEIEIPNGVPIRVDVQLAQTDAEKAQGLSGRKYLGDYEGMLFINDQDVDNSFWMKDMLIPLDILFIDSQNYIVDIKKDQQPCESNYCPSIYSKQAYRYVLEVNSGFSELNGIEEGYHVVQYLQ
jgi:uncharacterized membrane protein (UPF0127 family)